jgi:hypothetical protein
VSGTTASGLARTVFRVPLRKLNLRSGEGTLRMQEEARRSVLARFRASASAVCRQAQGVLFERALHPSVKVK